jgi:hypothetical protein
MAKHIYPSDEKQNWRDYILGLLTADVTYKIVNDDGTLSYKWLEPIGTNALPFDFLLSTKRIKQSQLIGIDMDPNDTIGSKVNIENCKKKFPNAKFYCKEWDLFCEYKARNDIGYIIHDLFDGADGKKFEKNLTATIHLANKCYKNIGEVFLVINTDLTAVNKRYGKTSSISDFIKTIKSAFAKNSDVDNLKNITLSEKNIYQYKNSSRSDTMISACIMLH